MSSINIKIKKYTDGKEANISINIKDSILKLKKYINEIFNIPPERQNLLFNGKILDKTKLIEDYDIKYNDEIILVKKRLCENYKSEFVNENQIQNDNFFDHENLFKSMGINIDFETYKYIINNIPLFDSLLPIMNSNPEIIKSTIQSFTDPNKLNPIAQIFQQQPNLLSNVNLKQMMQMLFNNNNNNFDYEKFNNLFGNQKNNNNMNNNNNLLNNNNNLMNNNNNNNNLMNNILNNNNLMNMLNNNNNLMNNNNNNNNNIMNNILNNNNIMNMLNNNNLMNNMLLNNNSNNNNNINNNNQIFNNNNISNDFLKQILDSKNYFDEKSHMNLDLVNGINIDYKKKYEKELEQLKEMGYNNDDINLDLLKKNQGNIYSFIDDLNNIYNNK